MRRTAHAAALLAEAGVVALVALVSPYRSDRDAARRIHEEAGVPFLEVWVATGLAECERRDPRGSTPGRAPASSRGSRASATSTRPPETPELTIGDAEPIPAAAARLLAALG